MPPFSNTLNPPDQIRFGSFPAASEVPPAGAVAGAGSGAEYDDDDVPGQLVTNTRCPSVANAAPESVVPTVI